MQQNRIKISDINAIVEQEVSFKNWLSKI